MSDMKFLAVAIVIAAVLISGSVVFVALKPGGLNFFNNNGTPSPTPSNARRVNVENGKFMQGDANAKVKIVEFGDFQCPICKRFVDTISSKLNDAYIKTGKVNFSWRDFIVIDNFPGGTTESKDAANAARCAGDQGKFWEFHDLLFSKQGNENSKTFTKTALKTWGKQLGLNEAQFNQCVDSDKYSGDVQKDASAGATAGVGGTPTLFVNGIMIDGLYPWEYYQSIIDAELKK